MRGVRITRLETKARNCGHVKNGRPCRYIICNQEMTASSTFKATQVHGTHVDVEGLAHQMHLGQGCKLNLHRCPWWTRLPPCAGSNAPRLSCRMRCGAVCMQAVVGTRPERRCTQVHRPRSVTSHKESSCQSCCPPGKCPCSTGPPTVRCGTARGTGGIRANSENFAGSG